MTSFTFLLTPMWIGPQHLMSSRCSDVHLVFSFPLAISSLFLHHCTTDSTRIVSLDHFPPPLSDAHPSPLCISGAVFLLFDCWSTSLLCHAGAYTLPCPATFSLLLTFLPHNTLILRSFLLFPQSTVPLHSSEFVYVVLKSSSLIMYCS